MFPKPQMQVILVAQMLYPLDLRRAIAVEPEVEMFGAGADRHCRLAANGHWAGNRPEED